MNFRETQSQLESSIGSALDSAEAMHRMAAAQVFEQMASAPAIDQVIGSVRPLYETGVAQLFELGRQANRTGGEIARSLLDRAGI